MGVNGIELVLRQRPVAPSEVHRDIVNPTGCEAAIEMPQSRHDHAHQGGLDSGPGLIEHQKVDAGLLGKTHTGYLLAHRMAELRAEARLYRRLAARRAAWRLSPI